MEIQHGLLDANPLALLADEKGESVARRALIAFHYDKSFRDNHKDFDHLEDIYNRKDTESDHEDIPRFNFVRQLITDMMGVILPSIPGCVMESLRGIDPTLPEFERDIRASLLVENEQIVTDLIDGLLFENGFKSVTNSAIEHAAEFGVGWVQISPDYSLDVMATEDNADIVEQIATGMLTPEDEEALLQKSARVSVSWLDTRRVYLEYGRTRFNTAGEDKMLRCSYIEYASRQSLIEDYPEFADKFTRSGYQNYEAGSNETVAEQSEESDTVEILTTWELVPIIVSGNAIEISDYILLKTVVASNALLYHEIFTRSGGELEVDVDEETYVFDTQRGHIGLPLVPFYLYEHNEHPFGWSVIEQLELAEDAINRIIAILMKYADRSLENAKVFVMQSLAGANDIANINAGMDDPDQKIIEIAGNSPMHEDPDINKILMKVNNMVPQPPPMLVQLLNMLLGLFSRSGNSANKEAIARSRSAAGKRTELAIGDRPLTMPVELVTDGIESVYNVTYRTEKSIISGEKRRMSVAAANGAAADVILNQRVQEEIPEFDANGLPIVEDIDLTTGDVRWATRTAFFEINSTDMPMKAKSETRGGLSLNPVQRAQELAAYVEMQWVDPETARVVGLPRTLRALDDSIKRKTARERQAATMAAKAVGAAPTGGMDGAAQSDIIQEVQGDMSAPEQSMIQGSGVNPA